MCNIAGYVGTENAAQVLIRLIQQQEGFAGGYYTGLAVLKAGELHYRKITGDTGTLLNNTDAAALGGHIGIMHSRSNSGGGDEWAHPFIGTDDGEDTLAYIANGNQGCFADQLSLQKDMALELAAQGYVMGSRRTGVTNADYPTLPDGSAVHMSDVMCQLIHRYTHEGRTLDDAMAQAFCAMPSEIVGLSVSLKEPEGIAWSRINMPVFVAFAPHGAYLASTPLAFPEDAGEPTLLPANSAGMIYKDHYTVRPFTNKPVEVVPADGRRIAAAYSAIEQELSAGEKIYSQLSRVVRSQFAPDDCCPFTPLLYTALYALYKQGRLAWEPRRVPGAREGLDAPQFVIRLTPRC